MIKYIHKQKINDFLCTQEKIMKKTRKISIFLSVLLIILAIFALCLSFSTKNNHEVVCFEERGVSLSLMSDKTKPVISSGYENGVCEFVYDGTPHSLTNISISSDQELVFISVQGQNEIGIENSFVEIGEHRIKVTAHETMTYSEPDPIELIVRVLPRTLSSKSSGTVGEISIINDNGFCLDNTYSATDISRSQKRAVKKAVKKQISYEEEIIEIVKLAPNKEAQNYDKMSLLMELPDNFSSSKNYRFFEYKSNGEIREMSYIINRGEFAISDIAADSIVVVSANKLNPYLWIWLLIASSSFVGMVLMIYFFAPRKLNFYLEGSKIYVVKLGRRQDYTLSDGLENYEWYLDKNLTVKAHSFGARETSKNYYAKIKR